MAVLLPDADCHHDQGSLSDLVQGTWNLIAEVQVPSGVHSFAHEFMHTATGSHQDGGTSPSNATCTPAMNFIGKEPA
jgi:hypothetical protein